MSLASRMPAQGLREAFECVLVGDFVVRSITKRWQNRDGRCECGLGQETVGHALWECPRFASERSGLDRCSEVVAQRLGACQRRLGAPPRERALQAWKAQQMESEWEPQICSHL